MFENEFYIKIDLKDNNIINKYVYLTNIFQHYWNYTHNPNFLYLYKENLKNKLIYFDIIRKKYLKSFNSDYNFSIDFSNSFLIVEEINKC